MINNTRLISMTMNSLLLRKVTLVSIIECSAGYNNVSLYPT